MAEHTTVTVRWLDGLLEVFKASEVRPGGSYLWMRLTDGPDRWIPTGRVRWFSLSPESHSAGWTPPADQQRIRLQIAADITAYAEHLPPDAPGTRAAQVWLTRAACIATGQQPEADQ